MSKKVKTKEWTPEYKYETLSGVFTDYRGNERDFTMVAVSIPMENEYARVEKTVEFENEMEVPDKEYYNDKGDVIDFEPGYTTFFMDEKDVIIAPVVKMLSVGVAVRCVRDKDTGIGERIAYGKAIKFRNHVLFVSHPGMINTKMVKALLEQEAEHFKKDPGSYLAGYNVDKFKFEKTGKIANVEMTEDEVNTFLNTKKLPRTNNEIPIKKRLVKELESLKNC